MAANSGVYGIEDICPDGADAVFAFRIFIKGDFFGSTNELIVDALVEELGVGAKTSKGHCVMCRVPLW